MEEGRERAKGMEGMEEREGRRDVERRDVGRRVVERRDVKRRDGGRKKCLML